MKWLSKYLANVLEILEIEEVFYTQLKLFVGIDYQYLLPKMEILNIRV